MNSVSLFLNVILYDRVEVRSLGGVFVARNLDLENGSPALEHQSYLEYPSFSSEKQASRDQ